MEHISIGELCKLLGISLSTAYRWLKSGKLVEDFRTLGFHRRFNLNSIKSKFLQSQDENKELVVAVYARVSSHDQKLDLERQKLKLIHYCEENNYKKLEIMTDLGSGLKRLINLILTKQIHILVLNHKDRLLRFGSELIFNMCKFNNIKIVILEDKGLQKSFEEDLTTDVIELMTN